MRSLVFFGLVASCSASYCTSHLVQGREINSSYATAHQECVESSLSLLQVASTTLSRRSRTNSRESNFSADVVATFRFEHQTPLGSDEYTTDSVARTSLRSTPWPKDPSSLLPCLPTVGGGCMGGHAFDEQQNKLLYREPAPPTQFFGGCQWQAPQRIAFVHVGKCAGESLLSMLKLTPLNFTHVHVLYAYWFFPEDYDLFIISVRDPIERIISAFNWGMVHLNYPSTSSCQQMFACFPELPGGVKHFAEALDDNTTCGAMARDSMHKLDPLCGHLAVGVNFYLQDDHGLGHPSVISVLQGNPNTHAFAVPSDNLTNATAALWDWLCIPHSSQPTVPHIHTDYPNDNANARAHDTYVSPEGVANLAFHTEADFLTMQTLASLADTW